MVWVQDSQVGAYTGHRVESRQLRVRAAAQVEAPGSDL